MVYTRARYIDNDVRCHVRGMFATRESFSLSQIKFFDTRDTSRHDATWTNARCKSRSKRLIQELIRLIQFSIISSTISSNDSRPRTSSTPEVGQSEHTSRVYERIAHARCSFVGNRGFLRNPFARSLVRTRQSRAKYSCTCAVSRSS